jgi:hypothetical protein
MQNVSIIPSETGAIINVYAKNPKFGYVKLQSEEESVEGGWIRNKVRTALLRAEVPLLEKFIQKHGKTGKLNGKIVVKEFLESALPDNFKARLNKELPYEKQIEPFVKRASTDGPLLTVNGERILRFSDYDASGNEVDQLVAHDNTHAVVEYRASMNVASKAPVAGEVKASSKKTAVLPTGDDEAPF